MRCMLGGKLISDAYLECQSKLGDAGSEGEKVCSRQSHREKFINENPQGLLALQAG